MRSGRTRPISVRISATDWVEGGSTGTMRWRSPGELKGLGCDLIDVSTSQTSVEADPDYGRLYRPPYSDRIRNEVGIATMTVGAVSSIDDVHNILVTGRADLCLLARPHRRSLLDTQRSHRPRIRRSLVPESVSRRIGTRPESTDPIPPDLFRRPT